MHWSVPFPGIFIKICRIPKILIELPISETSQLCIEVGAKVKYQEEHREIQRHNWQIPTWKNEICSHGIVADVIK